MFLKSNRLVENFQTFIGGLRVEFQAEFHHEETYESSSKWNASMPRVKFQAECQHKYTYNLSSKWNITMKKRTS